MQEKISETNGCKNKIISIYDYDRRYVTHAENTEQQRASTERERHTQHRQRQQRHSREKKKTSEGPRFNTPKRKLNTSHNIYVLISI